jgi:hypothetical protein
MAHTARSPLGKIENTVDLESGSLPWLFDDRSDDLDERPR